LNDDMDLAEEMLEYIVQTVLKERAEELKYLSAILPSLKSCSSVSRISYDEAVKILKRTCNLSGK